MCSPEPATEFMKQLATSPLWAITTYFNPVGYARRHLNYRRFRMALPVPLLAVELSFSTKFDLTPADADILMQVSGRSVLWQKERLLNLALTRLPKAVEFVAWLDCDIALDIPRWPENAIRLLEDVPLLQLFSRLYDLPPEALTASAPCRPDNPTGLSAAYLVSSGHETPNDFRPVTTKGVRRGSFGLAWAARRHLLDELGFYDAMILGSGDRALACAAYGRFEDAIKTTCMSERRAKHYLSWANDFYTKVDGCVGCLDGPLLHFWHGELSNRKYLERHAGLATFDFDPYEDIRIGHQGCWEWATEKTALHNYVKEYFFARKEDGQDFPKRSQDRLDQ
jgi:hypothetical protein